MLSTAGLLTLESQPGGPTEKDKHRKLSSFLMSGLGWTRLQQNIQMSITFTTGECENRTASELQLNMPASAQSSCLPSLSGGARAKIPTTTAGYSAASVPDLIHACVEGEATAWQEFIERFHRIIAITSYRAARRWGKDSPATVDDLTQEAYVKLCADHARVLRDFDSQHPDAIFAFLKVVTANVANDYFKRLQAGKRGTSQTNESFEDVERTGGAASPASSVSIERSVLLDQVDACLSAVAPADTLQRDRTIFWLYYRQGLTAKEIEALPSIGLSLKGVESTLHRLTQLVRARLAETRPTRPDARGRSHEKGV